MDEHELRRLMYTAQLPGQGAFVIRYPRGKGVLTNWRCPLERVDVGSARRLRDGNDVAVLSLGPVGNDVAHALDELQQENEALRVAHYDMRFLKPLDESALAEIGQRFRHVVTVEDGVVKGGLGSAILEWMNLHGHRPTVTCLGLPDEFVEHGTVSQLHDIVGISKSHIKAAIQESAK